MRVCTFDHTVGQLVEVLCVNPALAAAPGFEFALCERTAALEGLRKQSLSRVRRAERLSDTASSLAVTLEWVAGVRLSASWILLSSSRLESISTARST